ncbi:MAG: LysE/ArgO family amino acid transporter [Pseudomonadota bacterium]
MDLFFASLSGFVLGASLIIAIGAQNAFILRQGLLREHVLVLVLICATCDALLIVLGVAGFGTLVRQSQVLIDVVAVGGGLFLLTYAAFALRRALAPSVLTPDAEGAGSLKKAVMTCLAFTLLNPHVYLDTVILVGGLSAQYDGMARVLFGGGAVTASFVWFFSLGYGARLLVPVFRKPLAWRILDLVIAVIMTLLAVSLLMKWWQGAL